MGLLDICVTTVWLLYGRCLAPEQCACCAKLSAWPDAAMEEGTAIPIPEGISHQKLNDDSNWYFLHLQGLRNIYSDIHLQIVIM